MAWFDECLDSVSQEYVGLSLRLEMGAKNRFGVLADSGDGGAQWSGQGFDPTHNATHAGGIDRNTTMRSPKLGTRKKISWSEDPEWCWYTACHGPNS